MAASQKTQLVLDTNVIQYGCDGKYSDKLLELLITLEEEYEFAMSAISIYELFNGLSGKKLNTRIKESNNFIDVLSTIPIDSDSLRIAAALKTCYQCNEHTRTFANAPNIGDVLIGATAMHIKAKILTGNSNDFLFPFFEEKEVYILKPETQPSQKLSIVIPDVHKFNSEIKDIYRSNN